jgi:hypothetical protein
MRVEVERVEGLPPKKDGANSMWAKPAEVERLVALRREVRKAPGYAGLYGGEVRLELEVQIPPVAPRLLGDLDNFVTGVCDGLMAADPRIKCHPRWAETECTDIRPELSLLLADDSQVVEIQARRVADADWPWYRRVVADATVLE